MLRSRGFLKIYFALSLILGVFGGTATVYMALDHNPQQAYCDYVPKGQSGHITLDHGPCNIVFGNLVPLVVTNFLFVALIFLLPVGIYLGVVALIRWSRREIRNM